MVQARRIVLMGRSRVAACGLALATLLGVGRGAWAQAKPDVARLDHGLQARSLAPGVWVVEGANADFHPNNGCNIINTGFIATGAGVVVINTGPNRRYGDQLAALIKATTPEPVAQVIQLNAHPDYFLGHQAFAQVPRRATARTREGVAREAASYETNMFRLCGDWMRGTETLLPDQTLTPGLLKLGTRELELREWSGHTSSDLVLIDKASGVVFAGGLIFADRMPTTPHADLKVWLRSLEALTAVLPSNATVVPSHGPVHVGHRGAVQTRDYLRWLDEAFTRYAAQGLDMPEVLRQPVPAAFTSWAAHPVEYVRQVAHLYKRYEEAALSAPAAPAPGR